MQFYPFCSVHTCVLLKNKTFQRPIFNFVFCGPGGKMNSTKNGKKCPTGFIPTGGIIFAGFVLLQFV